MCEKLAALFSYNMDGSKKQEEAKQAEQKAVVVTPEPVEEKFVWKDDRNFLQKYTPLNIVREIKKRIVAG
jgi:hypothetical protein